jgi:hypothetical protein
MKICCEVVSETVWLGYGTVLVSYPSCNSKYETNGEHDDTNDDSLNDRVDTNISLL